MEQPTSKAIMDKSNPTNIFLMDKTALVSLSSLLSIEALNGIKSIAPDVILISQMIIGLLTIGYLVKKLLKHDTK